MQAIQVRSYKSRRKMERDMNRMSAKGYVIAHQSGSTDSALRRFLMPFIIRRHRCSVTYRRPA